MHHLRGDEGSSVTPQTTIIAEPSTMGTVDENTRDKNMW